MNEFKYYDIPSPFPTLARGLFTVELPKETEDEDEDRRYRIVVRGYDKFFNIGEVPWTHVRNHHIHIHHQCSYVNNLRIVVLTRSTHNSPLHSNPKIKRMHHIHSSPHSHPTHRHIQTLDRCGGGSGEEPCGCGGEVVGEAFEGGGEDEGRVGKDVMG